jgi:hypothetical protein
MFSGVPFEPISLPARQMNREPLPGVGREKVVRQDWGGVMGVNSPFRLDCDLGSLTVLFLGISAVSLLAFSGF